MSADLLVRARASVRVCACMKARATSQPILMSADHATVLVLCCACVICAASPEYFECSRARSGLKKYVTIGWAYVDLVNNVMFLLSGIFRVANLILVAVALNSNTPPELRSKIRGVGQWFYIEDQVWACVRVD